MEILLKANNVEKTYLVKDNTGTQKVCALDNVSLDIFQGETFGVIGESGSGKTTLGKTAVRLIEPTSGNIYFKGIDITNLRESHLRKFRKQFQIVFQDPYKSINPRLTAGSTIMDGMTEIETKRDKKQRARELLEIVGLKKEQIDNYPHQFSGGEKQRIAIARALSTTPEFIVCDEPTSNLDLSIQAKILNLLSELKERLNLTYMFISHNLKVVEFIADRVAVMYRGEIIELASAEEIIRHPLHPYTKTLIASSFFGEDKRAKHRDTGGKTEEGCKYFNRCAYRRPICSSKKPALRDKSGGHIAACWET